MIHKRKNLVLVVFVIMLAFGFSIVRLGHPSASSNPQSQCELAVLSDPDDPYYPLAEEIAAVENVLVTHNLQEVMDCQPIFLLWVVSPNTLSDARMMAFGQAVKNQPASISTGIITASTLGGARELWQRRTQVQGRTFFIANAPNPSALIDEGRIMPVDQGDTKTLPLTKSNFIGVLQEADYLTFTGHGGSTYLKLDAGETKITARELPPLDALVIGTGSCQTLRPWKEDSISVGSRDDHLESGRVQPSQCGGCIFFGCLRCAGLFSGPVQSWKADSLTGHYFCQLDANAIWAGDDCSLQCVGSDA